jgi:hypothetical protein
VLVGSGIEPRHLAIEVPMVGLREHLGYDGIVLATGLARLP